MDARDAKELHEALQQELNNTKIAHQAALKEEYARQMEQVQINMQNKMQEFQKAEQGSQLFIRKKAIHQRLLLLITTISLYMERMIAVLHSAVLASSVGFINAEMAKS